jgi:hypothetical protein
MKLKCLLVFLFVLEHTYCISQKNSRLLDSVLKSRALLTKVVQQKTKYKPQIIYTQINRDATNQPCFTNHTYLLDSNNYFYCASLVKLPCAIFALEKINSLKEKGISFQTPMLTDSSAVCQNKYLVDSSAENGLPSVEQHIKKMFLVSDNYAFNKLFEFVTPTSLNSRLAELGYTRARIVHRLDAGCVGRGNRYFNPINFTDANGTVLYRQESDSLKEDIKMPFESLLIGRNIYNKKKRLISERKDFSKSNYLPLKTVHELIKKIVFAEATGNSLQLGESDRNFLITQLGMYPRESVYPHYDENIYHDSFKKYFIYGSTVKKIESDSIRIFNIVGRAYGFLIDCAYIVDFNKKIEFMLSSVIYVNKRNSFGTGKYEYDTIGLPFLKELSLALYAFETKRKKQFLPNLDSFNLYKTPH